MRGFIRLRGTRNRGDLLLALLHHFPRFDCVSAAYDISLHILLPFIEGMCNVIPGWRFSPIVEIFPQTHLILYTIASHDRVAHPLTPLPGPYMGR